VKLPNANRATVDIRKLRDYCLDPESPKGRSKARVFASALGLNQAHADFLKAALLNAATDENCAIGERDEYGQRYSIEFRLKTNVGEHSIRTGWIVLDGEDFRRLTTCFVVISK
jgi:hypothetical protein